MTLLSTARVDRYAANLTAGQPQLFLCPLVTLVVTGGNTPLFCSGAFWKGQNFNQVLSISLCPTRNIAFLLHPHTHAVSCGHSRQPQDSELVSVNSFCICHRVSECKAERAWRQPSPAPPHHVFIPFFKQLRNRYTLSTHSCKSWH